MVHHTHLKCYQLKIGDSLYCDDCGFEVMVTKECDESCKKEGCCDVEEIMCCGKPMALRQHARCYELKKGDILVCDECGFKMEIIEECGENCKKRGCCDVTELMCCGEPMKIIKKVA